MPLFETVKRFFDATEWSYEELGGEVLLTGFAGEAGEWNCVGQTSEETQQFVFYSIVPEEIAEDHRAQVMEFITRINYGLAIGNFEMDLADGEVRFKTSIDVEGTEFSVELWRHVVYLNVTTMNTYLHGVLSVARGEVDAREMVTRIEAEALSGDRIDKRDVN
ncbi:MAG: YbjN domain-containing protein [Myxococcales bacterium]|nr:YbjN domain-containing protein [Myxococcales bacterium]